MSWSELRSALGDLVELRDPAGILSITVGVAPRAESNRTAPRQIALRNDLDRVREEARDRTLLERRLEEIEPHLDSYREPSLPENGHALFVSLERGELAELAVPVALPARARVGGVAHLLPLVEVLAAGSRAGLVSASKDELAVFELELGAVSELAPIDLEPTVGDWWPEMKGPAAPNPARGQQVVTQRDRYTRRLEDAYAHQLGEGAQALADVARRRRWTSAVLAGDRRLTRRLKDSLAPNVATITTRANLSGLPDAEVRTRLRGHLSRLLARDAAEDVQKAIAAESAGGQGVTGLPGTLAALGSARVARLVIDPDRTFLGTVGVDETLAPGETGSDLSDWIVAAAIAAGAEVLPVPNEAARPLADGIGALLRW